MTRVNETVIQDANLRRGLRVPGMALLGYRPFGPSPSRSAFPFRHVRHPSVHSSLAIAVGNQHGSRCGRYGRWGRCRGAQQNAGASRRGSRNHPGGPDASPMPVR